MEVKSYPIQLNCKGIPFDMGECQGRELKKILEKVFLPVLKQNCNRYLGLPEWVPTRITVKLLKRFSVEMLRDIVLKDMPAQAMRIKGLSHGSGIGERDFYLAMVLDILLLQVLFSPGASGCTTALVLPERNRERKTVLLNNFDYFLTSQEMNLVRHSIPTVGFSSWEVLQAPMAGCHFGVNQQGLAISCNSCFSAKKLKMSLPASLLMQHALQNCVTTGEVVELFKKIDNCSPAILTMVDKQGHACCLEKSQSLQAVRFPKDGLLVSTNHFLCPEMMEVDIPHDARFSFFSTIQRGERLHLSSEMRHSRLRELICTCTEIEKEISISLLLDFFKDHGGQLHGNDNTICRHGPIFSTITSMAVVLEDMKIMVTGCAPCEGEYTILPIMD